MNEIRLVPPPRDGLADAFRVAAARRRKKAATTGGASLMGAALLFATLTGGTGQVLTQEPAPPARGPQVVELVPVAPAPAGDTAVLADAPTDQERVAPLTPASPRSPRVATTPDPGSAVAAPPRTTRASPAAATAAASRYRTATVTRQDGIVTVPNDLACAVESSAQNGRLCSQVLLNDYGDPAAATLSLYLCNSTTSDKRLGYDRKDEVDFAVLRGSEVVWRWSVDHPRVTAPHEVLVATGTCTVWATAYPKVDQQGRTLAKGPYALRGTIDSSDAGVAATAVGQFTVR